ncbi:MAG: hypothetical protein GF333_07115 [Candidatus Omnitrophica bacterium]|nr:hypothetical protein [Candidatus Omnitrophota bacterium]
MKHPRIFFFLFFSMLLSIFPPRALPELIRFKNGTQTTKPVIGQTNRTVTVDHHGIPLVYFLTEIESIDGRRVAPASRSPDEKTARASNSDRNDLARRYAAQGEHFLLRNMLPEAESLFRKALARDRDLIEAHEGLGWVYFSRRQFRTALRIFEEIESLETDNPRIFDAKAQCYFYLQEYGKAKKNFLRAKDLFLESAHYEQEHPIIGFIENYLAQIEIKMEE